MTLALRDGPHTRDGGAIRMHPDLARIEHADAQYVAHLRGSGADDFREGHDAGPHQPLGPRALATLRLLRRQCLVVHRSHARAQGRLIVARVVLETEWGLIGELLLAYK